MHESIVLGAGGQARVVVALLLERQGKENITVLDLETPRAGETVLGVPVQSIDLLATTNPHAAASVYLALGDNVLRKEWYERVRKLGFELPNLISAEARLGIDVDLGDANVICGHAFVGPAAKIGNNNLLNTSCIIEHEARIGSHCHISVASVVAGRTTVGDCTLIGAGAVVIDRLSIAAGTTVGAGSTVIRSIEQPGETYAGSPAKQIGTK